MNLPSLQSPIGLIAGNGQFPLEFTENAAKRGLKVIAVAHKGETDPALSQKAHECVWVKVGQLGKVIATFKKHGVTQVAFAGGISRVRLFGGLKLDWRGVKLVARTRSKKDDVILRAIASELESEGLKVFGAEVLLESSVPQLGVLTARDLTPGEVSDSTIGIEAARAIGKLDIGQSVVAYDGLVTAVEAIEGTDDMIRRAGILTGGRGGVLVKLCKPQQDVRLDLPTVGEVTIDTMKSVGLTALILEAGKSIILNPIATIRAANSAGIAIKVVKE